jgi:hypothetical protein
VPVRSTMTPALHMRSTRGDDIPLRVRIKVGG